GYQMALQGRAGPALGIAAFGSFIAGTLGIVGLQLLSPPMVAIALRFGPPEYFSLMILGLVILTYLTQKSILKALLMAGVGILLGMVGLDNITGKPRFTMGIPKFMDGIGLIPLIMGLLGVSEVLANVEKRIYREVRKTPIHHLLPSRKDWGQSKGAILRGSVLGFFLGILPGGGAILASFVSYAIEKRTSQTPERFGKGAIEGVAGPESANNAAASGAFIPLLTLGIPSNVLMAILIGALMIHGINPGPMLMKEHPDVFWGVIGSMYVGNVMLLALNLPLIGIWVRILRIPHSVLFPLILLFCVIGAYSENYSVIDVNMMLLFGVIGYLMRKFDYEPAPLVLAFVLGPLMETALRQSLIMSDGGLTIFFTRSISAGCLLVAAVLLLTSFIPSLMKKRDLVLEEET
ncbi:MAG: tripartite tricarboxylate transporter permease, partial [Deltaproteobacteria bacterium]|nr:tripartite tricarboxylate transporter permease [Deltaproteobacteria bacterium]